MVSTTGSTARNHIDLTITYTQAVRIGNFPTIPVGGFIKAQVVPSFVGAHTTVDFLDPASVRFSVPAGISYTSEGFLDANKTVPGAPELSTWVMVLAGFCGLGALGSRRALNRHEYAFLGQLAGGHPLYDYRPKVDKSTFGSISIRFFAPNLNPRETSRAAQTPDRRSYSKSRRSKTLANRSAAPPVKAPLPQCDLRHTVFWRVMV
jgi:hypothetical protein